MKNFIIGVIGMILGIVIGFFVSTKVSFKKPTYIELKSDFSHPELGIIKKGVRLQYDEAMSEGFTRYILYLNISDAEQSMTYKSPNFNEIIPYWIESK